MALYFTVTILSLIVSHGYFCGAQLTTESVLPTNVPVNEGTAEISKQQQCLLNAIQKNMSRDISLCTCFAICSRPSPSLPPENYEITTTDKWFSDGSQCEIRMLITYKQNVSNEAVLCICYGMCSTTAYSNLPENNPTTDSPTPETVTEKWFGTEFACLRRIFNVYKMNLTKEEATCKCFGYCIQKPVPDSVTEVMLPEGHTTERWYGKGKECLRRALLEDKLNLTSAEYNCLCFDACTEEASSKLKEEHVKLGIQKKLDNDKVSIGFLTMFMALILVTGIFGNVLVIVTIAAFMGKTTVTNMYICSLAVADLLVVLVCVPFKIIETTKSHWEGGDAACRIVMWLYFGSFMCSVFTLATMSIERFLVICYPVYSHVISSTRRTGIIIAVTWVLAAVLSCPTFYVIKTNELLENVKVYHCLPDMSNGAYGKRLGFYIYVYIVIFIIPVSLMGFSYVRTCIALWKSIQKQMELKNAHLKSSQKDKDKKQQKASGYGRVQVIRVLIIILVVFIICWFPYLTTQLVLYSMSNTSEQYRLNSHISQLSKWFNLLSLANSCLNPILYGFLSRRYREGFKRCLKCDRKSVNFKKGSVITATSSIGGSIHKQSSCKSTARTSIKMETLSENKYKTSNGASSNPTYKTSSDSDCVNKSNGYITSQSYDGVSNIKSNDNKEHAVDNNVIAEEDLVQVGDINLQTQDLLDTDGNKNTSKSNCKENIPNTPSREDPTTNIDVVNTPSENGIISNTTAVDTSNNRELDIDSSDNTDNVPNTYSSNKEYMACEDKIESDAVTKDSKYGDTGSKSITENKEPQQNEHHINKAFVLECNNESIV